MSSMGIMSSPKRRCASRQLVFTMWGRSCQKLKKAKRSISSMTAEARACSGEDPLPICLRVGMMFRASLPQTLI